MQRKKMMLALFLSVFIIMPAIRCLCAETKTNEPIDISSKNFKYFGIEREGLFTGSVRVVQGNLVLTADKLRAKYDDRMKDTKEFMAMGRVRIVKDDLIAVSEEAVFFNEEQKIILTGKPVVSSMESNFSGEKITVYLKENRFIVERNVKGVVIPK